MRKNGHAEGHGSGKGGEMGKQKDAELRAAIHSPSLTHKSRITIHFHLAVVSRSRQHVRSQTRVILAWAQDLKKICLSDFPTCTVALPGAVASILDHTYVRISCDGLYDAITLWSNKIMASVCKADVVSGIVGPLL
jgi:hypothetical protein